MDGTPYSEAITDVHGPQNMKRTCGSFQDRLADQGLSLPEARRQVKGGGGGAPRSCLEAEAWGPGQELLLLLE